MNYCNIVENTLNELNNVYRQSPINFFNEQDFHSIFFYLIYPHLKELIRPEYPTIKRFKRKREKEEKDYVHGKHSFEPEAKVKYFRACYDFVILTKEFYKKYKEQEKFEKLSNKKICINSKEPPFIEIALEFKYFIKKLTQELTQTDIQNIQFDLFKLNESREVKKKMMIIFTRNVNKKAIERIKELDKNNIIKIFPLED